MKTVAIIQARMGSTRLPGKVLKKVLGKPLLEYQLERVKKSRLIDEIVVATTVKEQDQPIVDFCTEKGVSCYRGSEEDVLARYYEAANEYEAEIVVRLTSDCPVIDPGVIDRVIQAFLEDEEADYVSNTLERTFPRGMDTEVFSFQALEQAFQSARMQSEREHVTPYIWKNSDRFSIKSVFHRDDLSIHRWTVDTPEDFELIKKMIEHLYRVQRDFSMEDMLQLLDQHPQWKEINAHIEQKKVENEA
ncbi:spore coat polysaccharide biosynthesis protein SpsF [Melghiribacillus thermohalophilus]|uniref:Spore coat polysaccharide biosynthesis protein SpsF n=1 Tax=Melghiribacillus thermohalophilus TaxID=1324956 RepID=A0A4R3NCI1_9BACI|nr:glycosyltransferase family protein [Melghiribacillus thermohalophilus]TCT26465.1 spore coat polysaccharide biosynthesis protein SpsF [Melghiribacillus thermohalophilus]